MTFTKPFVTPYRFSHDMSRFAQDFDDLERLIDGNAAKDEIRSQVRFIAREVAALEADYERAIQEHADFQAAHALKLNRGVYYASDDPVPFCPYCYEAGAGKRVHLYGPVPLHASDAECWKCDTCNTSYAAKPGENFMRHHKRTGRYT